jgi:hypothetical protein
MQTKIGALMAKYTTKLNPDVTIEDLPDDFEVYDDNPEGSPGTIFFGKFQILWWQKNGRLYPNRVSVQGPGVSVVDITNRSKPYEIRGTKVKILFK